MGNALRDNKILIHNIYKAIKSRGVKYIPLGGKSNRINWRLQSKYNPTAMQYKVYGLSAKFLLSDCVICEDKDIVSIGIDVSDCTMELIDGSKYSLRDIIMFRLFTVDVVANYTVCHDYTHDVLSDKTSFYQGYGIHTIEELKDFLGYTIDTKKWSTLNKTRKIYENDVIDILNSIKDSFYYQLLDSQTDEFMDTLYTDFFRKVFLPKSTVGYNKKANFGDTFLPIVSFDFSKSGKVKYMSSSGFIVEEDLDNIDINDIHQASITNKLFDILFKEKYVMSNQYTLAISK